MLRAGLLSNYAFDQYYTKKAQKVNLLAKLAIVPETSSSAILKDVETIKVTVRSEANFRFRFLTRSPSLFSLLQILAEATMLARDLTNERADVANPQYLEDVARQVAQEHSMKVSN